MKTRNDSDWKSHFVCVLNFSSSFLRKSSRVFWDKTDKISRVAGSLVFSSMYLTFHCSFSVVKITAQMYFSPEDNWKFDKYSFHDFFIEMISKFSLPDLPVFTFQFVYQSKSSKTVNLGKINYLLCALATSFKPWSWVKWTFYKLIRQTWSILKHICIQKLKIIWNNLIQYLNKIFTEIIDLDFRISFLCTTVHSLYVKVKSLLSLVNLPKFENFGENKFEQLKEKNSKTNSKDVG